MSLFRINTGVIFRQPYQGCYALVRQILAANSGMSLSRLEATLRQHVEGHNLVERIIRLQQSGLKLDFIEYNQKIIRQCPICARALYHAEIYNLPWLARCPIHNVALTSKCPVCERPWPTLAQLPKRSCTTCGLPKISLNTSRNFIYQPDWPYIRNHQIYRFVTEPITTATIYGLAFKSPIDNSPLVNWCCSATPCAKVFPALRLRHTHIIDEETLARCCDSDLSCLCQRSKLSEINPTTFWYHHHRVAKSSLVMSDEQVEIQKNDFKIMNRIIVWIRQLTSSEHPIQIRDYRYLSSGDFEEMSIICPYSLALSIWFFYIASQRYGEKYWYNVDQYWFDKLSYIIPTIYYVFAGHRFYKVSKKLSAWIYERSLEILYVNILTLTLEMLSKNHPKFQSVVKIFQSHNTITQDFITSTAVNHNRLTICYKQNSLLHQIFSVCNSTPWGVTHDNEYVRFINSHRPTNAPFHFNISQVTFSYQSFLTLHTHFRYFLERIFSGSINDSLHFEAYT